MKENHLYKKRFNHIKKKRPSRPPLSSDLLLCLPRSRAPDVPDKRRRVLRAVERRARDQHRRAALDEHPGVFLVHAAVHLDLEAQPGRAPHPVDLANLLDRAFDHPLPAEARVDGHHQRQVDVALGDAADAAVDAAVSSMTVVFFSSKDWIVFA